MDFTYIPLGFDCSPASALESLKLRGFALPFDWVQTNPNIIMRCINDDFKLFHRNLVLNKNKTRVIDGYGIQYPHDYPKIDDSEKDCEEKDKHDDDVNYGGDQPIIDNYNDYTEKVLVKYKRRIDRFINLLQNETKPIILLVRLPYAEAIKIKDFFEKKYNKTNIVVVVATKEMSNPSTPFIVCCDPEKNNVWNDAAIWNAAIEKGKRLYQENINNYGYKRRSWKLF
jgi:hypothetical protein